MAMQKEIPNAPAAGVKYFRASFFSAREDEQHKIPQKGEHQAQPHRAKEEVDAVEIVFHIIVFPIPRSCGPAPYRTIYWPQDAPAAGVYNR